MFRQGVLSHECATCGAGKERNELQELLWVLLYHFIADLEVKVRLTIQQRQQEVQDLSRHTVTCHGTSSIQLY